MTPPRKTLRTTIIGVCIALALVLMTPTAGVAAKKKKKNNGKKLTPYSLNLAHAALSGVIPKKMLRAQINQVAKLSKRNPNKVARETAKQAHKRSMQMMRNPATAVPGLTPKLPKTEPGQLPYVWLPPGENVGDIFYSPSRWYFVMFGHNGMYTSPDSIIQHPGGQEGQVVQEIDRRGMLVFNGARIGRVLNNNGKLASLKVRQGAVDWARSRIGDIYNKNPLNTYHISKGRVGTEENAQNCSQLIWAAYMTQGIDLDDVNWKKNGALYGWMDRMSIFPLELMQSSHVQIYKYL
jgi:uncharacterized protein YycO